MNLIKQLELALDMTSSEKNISAYILDHGDEVLTMSVKELANATFTSPATVVRLTKKLGLDGYNDFKIKYSAELQESLHTSSKIDVNFPFASHDSYQQVAHQLGTMAKEVIDDTIQLIDYEQLRLAVNTLYHAECIDLYGLGNSINAATSFQHKLTRIGRMVNMRSIPGEQHFLASASNAKHAAIIISYSGETAEIIRVAKVLKAMKTPIIAITSIGDNRLSHFATYTLHVCSREKLFKKIAPYASRISIDYVLDLIYALLFQKDYDANMEKKIWFDQLTDNRMPVNSPISENNN